MTSSVFSDTLDAVDMLPNVILVSTCEWGTDEETIWQCRIRSEYVRLNIMQLRPYRAPGERLTGKGSIANYNIMMQSRVPMDRNVKYHTSVIYFNCRPELSRVAEVGVRS